MCSMCACTTNAKTVVREWNLRCLQLEFTSADVLYRRQLEIHLVNGTVTIEILHSATARRATAVNFAIYN